MPELEPIFKNIFASSFPGLYEKDRQADAYDAKQEEIKTGVNECIKNLEILCECGNTLKVEPLTNRQGTAKGLVITPCPLCKEGK